MADCSKAGDIGTHYSDEQEVDTADRGRFSRELRERAVRLAVAQHSPNMAAGLT